MTLYLIPLLPIKVNLPFPKENFKSSFQALLETKEQKMLPRVVLLVHNSFIWIVLSPLELKGHIDDNLQVLRSLTSNFLKQFALGFILGKMTPVLLNS